MADDDGAGNDDAVVSRPTVPLAIPVSAPHEAPPPGPNGSPGDRPPLAGPASGVPAGSTDGRPAAGRRRRGRDREAWTAAARVPLTRPVRLAVASAVGGAGTSTIALVLAELLADLRADRVAILDAVPRGGTLGVRVGGQPGAGLDALLEPGTLGQVAADGSATAWSQWATIDHASRVAVFGRSRPLAGPPLTIADLGTIAADVTRQWPVLVIDTGAAQRRGDLQDAVLQLADVLVVVTSPSEPALAATASWLADLRPGPDRRVGVVIPLRVGDVDRAANLLGSYCHGGVVQVRTDPALAGDRPLPLVGNVRRSTRDSLLQLAGMVMQVQAGNKEQG